MGDNPAAALMVLVLLVVLISSLYWYGPDWSDRRPRRRHPHRRRCGHGDEDEDDDEEEEEYFTPTGQDAGAAPAPVPLQQVLDFSDVTVTGEQRAAQAALVADTSQLQTVNDRFNAAKRNILEHKVKTGVYTNKQRRKLVETLLRRPHCGRRVRSWRTENSDYLRGDVRPKPRQGSTNLIRSAKNNPEVDLHPGALGPLSGLAGRWLSEENLPANLGPEPLVYNT